MEAALTYAVRVSIPQEKLARFKGGVLIPVGIAGLPLLLSRHDTSSAVMLAKVNPGVGGARIKDGADGDANIHDAIQDAILLHTANAAQILIIMAPR